MKDAEKRFPFIPFLINLLIPLIFGALAGIVRNNPDNAWFKSLVKPHIIPTAHGLAIIRSSLLLIIGFSSFLVWRERKTIQKYNHVLFFYFLMLSLHVIWTLSLYYFHNQILSMIVMLVSTLTVTTNIIIFHKIKKVTAWLLVPYLLWTLFSMRVLILLYLLN